MLIRYIITLFILLICPICFGANFTLEITNPQPSLDTNSRYYKTYTGLEYKVPVVVFGGEYPFTYSLTTSPSGMTIDATTGIITWSNPVEAGSPHSVTAQVTDDESSTDSVSWTITVDTTNAIFLDAAVGDGGVGTIGDPFNSLVDVYTGTDITARNNSDYFGCFMYFRAGTYDPEGYFENSGQQYQLEWFSTTKPYVWIEYPGETVIIDHDRTASGAFFDLQSAGARNDFWVQGIKFQDMLNHAFRVGGDRVVFFDCEFSNQGPGVDGNNSSSIMLHASATVHDYVAITYCDFNTHTGVSSFQKIYECNKLVIANNTHANTSDGEGTAIKADSVNIDIRRNTYTDALRQVLGGNWDNCNNMEFRWNLVLGAYPDSGAQTHGALTMNHDNTSIGPVYIYRNTLDGICLARRGTTGDGPFNLTDNVIVNEDLGTPADSHIQHGTVDDTSVYVLSGNIVGYAADNIIDANGDLMGIYTQYLGTKGYQLLTGGMSIQTGFIFGSGIKLGN